MLLMAGGYSGRSTSIRCYVCCSAQLHMLQVEAVVAAVVATSPAPILRLPWPWPCRSFGRARRAAGRRARAGVDPVDLHAYAGHRGGSPAAAGAVEDRALLVELPPVAAQPAHGQHALVARRRSATNAPAPITPVTSPSNSCVRSRPRTARARAGSSARRRRRRARSPSRRARGRAHSPASSSSRRAARPPAADAPSAARDGRRGPDSGGSAR